MCWYCGLTAALNNAAKKKRISNNNTMFAKRTEWLWYCGHRLKKWSMHTRLCVCVCTDMFFCFALSCSLTASRNPLLNSRTWICNMTFFSFSVTTIYSVNLSVLLCDGMVVRVWNTELNVIISFRKQYCYCYILGVFVMNVIVKQLFVCVR